MKSKALTLCVILALAALARPAGVAEAKIINRIIARVNNEIVTQRQFERKQQELRQELAQKYSGAELEKQYQEQRGNLLRGLIDEDLMVQKAKDLDISVETDVVKRLDDVRAANHLDSLQELEKAVEAQGIVWEDFQDQIRRQLLMQQVIEHEVGSRVNPTREDARKYFEAHRDAFASPGGVHLAEVLISNDKHKPDEAEKRAQDALAELKGGAKWEDVVKKYSDNADAGPQGDIGFFKQGTMAPAVASAIAKLDVNETSNVVQVPSGYIILKVMEIRTGGSPKFEEVEQQVESTLYNDRIQGALRNYLGELRRESYIYLAPGYVDSGAVKSTNTDAPELNE
ncbi:MAG TPA: peptidyl-prolyl cis-trans isomerase [Terriglobia bacterium]|nr:peptidyl-prolyl cis-trans isomerase [Terriglobia bacterium]